MVNAGYNKNNNRIHLDIYQIKQTLLSQRKYIADVEIGRRKSVMYFCGVWCCGKGFFSSITPSFRSIPKL